jgi:hypothetical protein
VVKARGGAEGCLPSRCGEMKSDGVRMNQVKGSGGCFAAEKAGVCEKKIPEVRFFAVSGC